MSFDPDRQEDVATYPLLSLKNVVIFPNTARSLIFSHPKSLKALKEAHAHQLKVFVVTLRKPDVELNSLDDLHEVGVIGRVRKLQQLPNGALQALFEGHDRGGLLSADFESPYIRARVKKLDSRESASQETPQLVEALKAEFFDYLDLQKSANPLQWNRNVDARTIPAGLFADAVASLLKVSLDDLQEVLATLDTRERVELVYRLLFKEIKQKEFERDLKSRVEEQMAKRQKEYFLNEQMKAIQDEMEEGDTPSEFDELQQKIDEAGMPEQVRETAEKELKRLRQMGGNAHEATPVRNYLDWLTTLPWSAATTDDVTVAEAQKILDEDHYGLDKAKERIVEYLAVAKAVGKLKGPILCLSGPPGVGKTSLAKSMARSLNRKFARISLGGVRDEAEIRGHRRTYVGALPGKILQTMKKVKTTNPLILLDEIDKLSQHYFGGGPTAAMLEVLDPEQNHAFMDHYLEVEYDLSNVLFVCTANNLADVPAPLRDRMEILELSGYTELEKLQIAKRFLLPKQKREHGLEPRHLHINDKQILQVIRNYTREAGVRSLERVVSKLCRKAVTERLKSDAAKDKAIRLTAKKAERWLGPARYQHSKVEKENEIGLVNGLAWTSVGGEMLSIEATTMRGSGKVTLTGKLGDVMKESAQAALSYVRANANALGVHSKVFKERDFHIHVPAGGTPKDGPSAGVALAAAIVSALTGIPIRWDVALTGEITLRGAVLPIGGLKEKLMAAKRANMRRVLIPEENEKDLAETPKEILKGLNIQSVSRVSEVIPELLETMPTPVADDDDGQSPKDEGAHAEPHDLGGPADIAPPTPA